MIPVLLASDVRRQDADAVAHGISVDTLMRAAGTAVASTAASMLGRVYGAHVVVVCGKGNNGGDGLVAARSLARRGASVKVCLPLGEPSDGAAGRALHAFGARVASDVDVRGADLVIDALFGVGLSRPLDGVALDAVRAINAAGCSVLSVDVPSGVDADTGTIAGEAVRVDRTVALGGLKPGLMFADGAAHAGVVEIADIGMPQELASGTIFALEAADVAALLPARGEDANKYRSGMALVVAGSRSMPGAAVLTASACIRAGAGYVLLASPEPVCRIASVHSAEIVTLPLADSPEGVFDEKGLEVIRERLDRAGALAVGPGLSRHPATVDAVRALVTTTTIPLVLDADGLNAFEGEPDLLRGRGAVLTPHAGEFARLVGAPVADRIAGTRALAERTGCVVLLKGAGSVIASPDGRVAINPTGGANLASAGTGDVLTGIIAALLARGLSAFDAAACGAWIHGATADAIDVATPAASDLIEALPVILGGLGR